MAGSLRLTAPAFGSILSTWRLYRRVADLPAVAYNDRHAPAHLGLARGVGGAPDRRPGPVPGGLAGSAIRFRLLRFSGQPHRRFLLPGEDAAGDGGLLAVPPSVRRRTRCRGAAIPLLPPSRPHPAGLGGGAGGCLPRCQGRSDGGHARRRLPLLPIDPCREQGAPLAA